MGDIPRVPWQKMKFKNQRVWVEVDAEGRTVLDGDGRAAMKYREDDSMVYRPAARNLEPDGDGPPAAAPRARRAASPRAPLAAPRPGTTATGPAVQLWTDGACTGNPGPMGIGVVLLDGEHRRELSEYLGRGTNNIAELTAIERGLDLVAEQPGFDRTRRVRVHSDSGYALGVLGRGWKAKANQELVGRIRERLRDFPDVEFVHVRGHAGVKENERCDELARNAIRREKDG